MAKAVTPRVDELRRQWEELEMTTTTKGEKLFDANRHVLYEQSCDDIDGWITEIESQIVTEDTGHDLTTVNLLVQKQNVSNVLKKTYQIDNYKQCIYMQRSIHVSRRLQWSNNMVHSAKSLFVCLSCMNSTFVAEPKKP